ncbi:MAG: transporter substrate-binding domain-containing protein [Lachnospiraceae bacterium]|nr:transporter substrate-binding domain-containing protein [Lachnospiraceae bacterium]
MQKRKIAVLFMACILIVGVFAACGKTDSGDGSEAETTDVSQESDTSEADMANDTANSEKRTIRVWISCNHAPFNWAQSTDDNGAVKITAGADELGENGAPSGEYSAGYDILMAQHICDELGYELEIYTGESNSLGMIEGTIDCTFDGQTLSTVLTEPYYYISPVVIVKNDGKYADAKSLDDLSGAVCASTGTGWEEFDSILSETCISQIPDAKTAEIGGYGYSPALLALDDDKCDVLVTTRVRGKLLSSEYKMKMLDFSDSDKGFEVNDEDVAVGIYVSESDTELKDAINSVLSKMTKEDFDQIMDEAISNYNEIK